MTAEIAILNRYGVALAADSAVSIGGADQPKIYNTVNKLFSLSKRAPVGAMVFGNALLSGVPWETVVKAFRQELGSRTFEELHEYADALLKFVETTQALFSPEQERSEFIAHCLELYSRLQRLVESQLHSLFEESGEATPEAVAGIVAEVFASELRALEGAEALEDIPDDYGSGLVEKFAESADLVRDHVFESLPLSDDARTTLVALTSRFIERPPRWLGLSAGLVVAGFGETEFAPVLIEFEIYGAIGGRLRRRRRSPQAITDENNAVVVPFAQREMVDLFMSGIDPVLQEVVEDALSALTDALPDLVAEAIPDTSAPARESLRTGGAELLETYRTYLTTHIQTAHVQPILDAVAALPKEELAAMAEALVNLTSFKRRVTLDAETVGGPIDVAVISKGDGLVWIERKHYFDPALNHHFFANYFRYGFQPQEDS